MELKFGYETLEEQKFFEWLNSEIKRVENDVSMPEYERNSRRKELGELSFLSSPERHGGFENMPCTVERYKNRLATGTNYYSRKPLHWDSSAVK
ncbi:MAG: hypothetical protein IKS15_02670 [Opitutales bacterium]|nr:hypothetical protein [Opitutales bacterium]